MQAVTIFGSNLGNRQQTILQAVRLLSGSVGQLTKLSSFYETEPWGFECTENFINLAAVFESSFPPSEFLHRCLETEKRLGRRRHAGAPRYDSRPIDIDFLFYDSLIVDTPELTLPHPRISERNFVLVPLAEILPDFIHPLSRKSVSELLASCPDRLSARRIGTVQRAIRSSGYRPR